MPRTLARRALALLLPLMLAGGLNACRNDEAGRARVIVVGSQPRLVDPAAGTLDPGEQLVVASLAQGLVAFDAGGNIVGGLAERWNVSDDGLSYIFRLAPATWADGGKVTAKQVVQALKRSIEVRSRNPLRDTLGAVTDIVAMTDRVIEIRLAAPRPNLLALLAQPEFGILRAGAGTGPFTLEREKTGAREEAGWLRLTRSYQAGEDDEEQARESVLLKGASADQAIADFVAGNTDLVVGGTFADLPLTKRGDVPRGALRFDPASGLFGLIPLATSGPFATVEGRAALSRAIDRDSFLAALSVPGLIPRATVLEQGLDGAIVPTPPAWAALPADERRAQALDAAARLFKDKPTVRLFLPAGPGADLLFNQLVIDWGSLGLTVERASSLRAADFALLDEVAPSASPAWFVRRFRCGLVPVCDGEADKLMDGAREALVPAQRSALLTQAAGRIDDQSLFIPLSAPVRWSLAANDLSGFRVNRFARHTLVGLGDKGKGRMR